MSEGELKAFEELNAEQIIYLLQDALRRTILHYGFWFREVEHQTDFKTAIDAEKEVWARWFPIVMKRMSATLGYEAQENGIPTGLIRKSKQELVNLFRELGKNWLAQDGIWFQAMENLYEMDTAKRCNDSCLARFSSLEAERAKDILGIPEKGGVEGLKQALNTRLYSLVNKQEIEQIDENTLIFRMIECRVQIARRRKGLPEYPCKSGGLVEYSFFAKTIDPRFKTQCIGCPPDEHPKKWWCSWKFTLSKNKKNV